MNFLKYMYLTEYETIASGMLSCMILSKRKYQFYLSICRSLGLYCKVRKLSGVKPEKTRQSRDDPNRLEL